MFKPEPKMLQEVSPSLLSPLFEKMGATFAQFCYTNFCYLNVRLRNGLSPKCLNEIANHCATVTPEESLISTNTL
ncbi:hypothetical protein L596_030851 [Steinernema carpocapsae]|uniref:Uncharacterized protein n=1 Tax=Steinernema carpocapsae TaxID=34508 RepID=A0A4U5LNC4_STECR|nr:hypothetical protein L596_030851 [Steinernema carpocapsae]